MKSLSAKTDLTYKVQLLARGVANVTCDVKLRALDLIFMVDSEVTFLYSQSAALMKGTVVTANKGTAEVKPEAEADIFIHILTLPPTLPLSLPPSLPSPNHSPPLSPPE